MKLWTKRKFWDDTEAIFINNNGRMSCYDLDSDELGAIINEKMSENLASMEQWLELKALRMEHNNNAKKSN